MREPAQRDSPINVFYSYAPEDEKLREQLQKHLSVLRRQGVITEWHNYKIEAGVDMSQTINEHLEASSLILLLVSSDFLASDYCYSVEMQSALERHNNGTARVIPILLRAVDWQEAPFAELRCLPGNALPVTSWAKPDEAFEDVAKGIRAVVKDMRNDLDFTLSHPPSVSVDRQQKLITVESKIRIPLLQLVRKTWITELLEPTLYNDLLDPMSRDAPSLRPDLRMQSDAVHNPWKDLVHESTRSAHPVRVAKTITEIYKNAVGKLLILGESGSGKTTLLLQLTNALLRLAEQNENNAIPVVFNLASWTEKRLPLSTWLVQELNMRYDVRKPTGASLIRQGRITLLLDGLDEVPLQHRAKCINAINAYQHEHPLVSIVVCSRNADYEASKTLLRLKTAVVVQPLTFSQIDAYLEQLKQEGSKLREVLHSDPILQELAKTPLVLSILLCVFQGESPDNLSNANPSDDSLRQIFEEYVKRMLSRGTPQRSYDLKQTLQWLTWLAEQMRQRHQAIFYIEQIQPYLLPERQSLRIYELFAIRLPDILIGICVALGVFALFFSKVQSVILIYGFFGGLIGSLIGRKEVERDSSGVSLRKDYLRRLVNPRYLRNGLLFGLSFGLIYTLLFGAVFGLPYGIVYAFIAYILSFLLGNKQERRPPISMESWSVTNLWYKLITFGYLRIGLSCGICFGLGYVISTEFANQFHIDHIHVVIPSALAWMFNYTLIGVLLCIIFEKRKREVQLAEVVGWSWTKFLHQLIASRHLTNSLFIGLFTGLIIGISSWLRINTTFGLDFGLSTGLIFALSYWILLSLFAGLSSDTLEDSQRVFPNQGIRRSISNSLLVGCISWLVIWFICASSLMVSHSLAFNIDNGVHYGLTDGLIVALVFGICSGTVIGLLSGGYASIQHYILRWLLWRSGVVPWNYTRFLDYAYKRILLQKRGGGYAFIHNLLLDYFASQLSS